MVMLTFTYTFFASAALGVLSILIPSITTELQWRIGDLSSPIGVRLVLFGAIAPFAGSLMLRFGYLAIVKLSGALLMLGLLIVILMTAKWQTWLGLGFLLGIASGLTAMQLASNIAANWFAKKQGFVIGIINGAIAAGALVFIPASALINEYFGWRIALSIPAIGALLSWTLILLIGCNKPSDIHLHPYGGANVAKDVEAPDASFIQRTISSLKIGAGNSVFWTLTVVFAISGATTFGLSQAHLIPILIEQNVSITWAAWLLVVIGVFDLLGSLLSGYLSDRWNKRILLIVYFVLRAMMLLWLATQQLDKSQMIVFAVLFGLVFMATIPPVAQLLVSTFGKDVGTILFGWLVAAHHLSAGLATVVLGEYRDHLGNYGNSLHAMSFMCFIAAAFVIAMKDPQSKSHGTGHTSRD